MEDRKESKPRLWKTGGPDEDFRFSEEKLHPGCSQPATPVRDTEKHSLRDLSCPVCLEVFTEPKVLPCCHTVCLNCLKGIQGESVNQKIISCPQCRTDHLIPHTGWDGFLTDYALIQTNSGNGGFTDSCVSDRHPAECNQCEDGNTSVMYCVDCVSFLCDACHIAHQRLKICHTHNVIHVDQLSQDMVSASREVQLTCEVHPRKVLDIYCKSCHLLVCSHCLTASHLDHTLAGVSSDTRETIEKDIHDLLKSSQNGLSKFLDYLEYVTDVEDLTLQNTQEVKKEVSAAYATVISSLQSECEERTREIEEQSSAWMKSIWSQKDHIEQMLASLKTAVRFVQRSLTCPDMKFLKSSGQAISQLCNVNKFDWNENSVADITNSGIRFQPKLLFSSLTPLAGIYIVPRHDTLDVDVCEIPSTLYIGKELNIRLQFVDQHGRPSLKFQLPSVSVSGQYREKINVPQECMSVARVKRTVYVVTVKPVFGGKLLLSIAFFGADPPLKKRDYEVVVTGHPPLGARVSRGPDWAHGNRDGGINSQGTVKNSHYSTNGYHKALLVDWDMGSSNHICRWGEQGEYDVQLV